MCKLRCDGELNTWTRYARCLTSYELRHETKINSRKYFWIRLSDLENVLIHSSMPLCQFIASAIVSQFIVCCFFVCFLNFGHINLDNDANALRTAIQLKLKCGWTDRNWTNLCMNALNDEAEKIIIYEQTDTRGTLSSRMCTKYSLQQTVCAFQRNMKAIRGDKFYGLIRCEWNDFDSTTVWIQEKEKWPDRDIPMHTVWTECAIKVSILLRSIHRVSRSEFRWFPWRHICGAIVAHVLHFQCYSHRHYSPLSIAANSTVCNLFQDNVADKVALFNLSSIYSETDSSHHTAKLICVFFIFARWPADCQWIGGWWVMSDESSNI